MFDLAVTGARGQIGRWLLLRAREMGLRVLAVSRSAAPTKCPANESLSWTTPQKLHQFGCTQLAHAAPLETLGSMANALGPERIIAFSSTSLHSKRGSDDATEQQTLDTLRAAEAGAEKCLTSHCRSVVLLRPTMVYGAGMDQSLSRAYGMIDRWHALPVPRSATGLRQPVHADDLAQAALACLGGGLDGFSCFEIGGGSRLASEQLLVALFRAQARKPRLIRLPQSMLRLGLRLLRILPGYRSLSPSLITRVNQDQVVDNGPVIQALGINPRPFEPRPEDFQAPPWPGA